MRDMGDIPEDSLLVTLDVAALYPNIPIKEGMEAVAEALTDERPDLSVKPTNRNILRMLKLVLTKNNFKFNGNHFIQLQGVSMGTKASPAVGNRFLDKFVYIYKLQPLVWIRYIDDVFCIWTYGMDELQEFVIYLNTRMPTINFTMESSKERVAFLDTTVKIAEGKIETDLYFKKTDSHNYLLYNSSHPRTTKDSIPYSQFLRIRRICSRIEDFDKNVIILSTHFVRRGYPIELITEAAIMARRKPREELLNKKEKVTQENEKQVFLVSTYNPAEDYLKEIVRNNWDLLGKSPTTQFIHQMKLRSGYRRPKNLKRNFGQSRSP
jgi:hypothetical protein